MTGMLLQGLTGHPFGSPDMIGGGEYLNFQECTNGKFDAELFVRYCEIAALMPVMQFSAAPWRILGKEDYQKVLTAMQVRGKICRFCWKLCSRHMKQENPLCAIWNMYFRDRVWNAL